MPNEKWLRDNPFETQPFKDGIIWFDPDAGVFWTGPNETNGCDDATEYPTFADAVG